MFAFKNIIVPAVCLLLLHSCKSKDQKDTGPTISTGKTVELLNEKVDESGILYVEKAGDSLDGLLMYVPDAAFAGSHRFNISYAPITSHELGDDFNPVSPLITISCGGGFSDSIITMEIPVHLKPGQFAMGFLYDERTGKLEGMPLLKLEKDRVVIALRNFSHSMSVKGSPVAAQAAIPDAEPVAKIVMSAVDEKSLLDKYDSGFRPGVDDCPSVNRGSVLEPGGHCSGQSQLMMWYYENKKKKGSPGLFSLLEADGGLPTPDLWQDDTKAIRFSSLMQNAERNRSIARRVDDAGYALAGILATDLMTLYAFSYAIRLTGEPQFIEIREDGFSSAGHAMVVYKVENNILYIADPNFPGNKTRRVIFDENIDKFLSYNSARNADEPALNFKDFFYIGSTALVSPSVAEKFWEDMEAGNLGEDKFPVYTIRAYNNKEFVPFEDGFTTEEYGNVISFSVECSIPVELVAYENTEALPVLAEKVLPGENGKYIAEYSFKVKPGEFRIGICIRDFGNKKWIGFKWANVNIKNTKKEDRPRTDFKPPHGDLAVVIKVNGMRFELEKCSFSISGNSFVLDGPAGADKYRISIRTDSFHGEDEYNDVSFNWSSNQPGEQYGDYLNKKNGYLHISKWGEGKMEGVFNCEAYDDYHKKTVKAEGFFAYKSPEQ